MIHNAYIFFGRAGSGKGTQLGIFQNRLMKEFGKKTILLNTGEGIRNIAKQDLFTSKLIINKLTGGELLPHFISNYVISDILINEYTGEEIIIADGFPRTREQTKTIIDIFNFIKVKKVALIYLDVPTTEATQRLLKRARDDDNLAGIQQRMDDFDNIMINVLDVFKTKDFIEIHKIDGVGDIDKIHETIWNTLEIS